MDFPVVAGLPAPGRTLVMGVVNVTPDSFSDGGHLVRAGGCSGARARRWSPRARTSSMSGASRPGRAPNGPRRPRSCGGSCPTVEGLVAAGACVSVDTMRAEVAAAAVAEGARLVNDVSGGRADPAMLETVAGLGCRVRVHALARARPLDAGPGDVRRRGHRRRRASCPNRWRWPGTRVSATDRLVVDAGFGFAKTGAHNWQLLDRFARARRARAPAARRRLPEVLPRHPAAPTGRFAPPAPGPRRRHGRADHPARPAGGLGRAGARRAGQP